MTFSICHTLARPDAWRAVYDAWLANAIDPSEIEYILVCDRRWGFTELPTLRPQDKVLWNDQRRCYVDGVNIAAAASTGGILIVNADDQFPCEQWSFRLLEAIADTGDDDPLSEADFVIEVSTNTPQEHERQILVMPVLSRGRYERFGWVLFPQYEGVYADNDFAAMAKRDDCIIDARHLVFPHKHWINGEREKDEQDRAQNSDKAYSEGRKLFAARKRINFAGIPPKLEAPTQELDAKIPMVAFATPGNNWGAAWLDAWTHLWGYVVGNHKYNVTHVRAYTSNAGMVRQMMAKVMIETNYGVPLDYVLWIDDDNTVTPEQFEMLLADLREHPEYDAIAGWTWCGGDDFIDPGKAQVSCGAVLGLELTDDKQDVKFCHIRHLLPQEIRDSPTDLIEIGYSGFPCVLMRAELLRKAGKNPFNPFVDDRCEWGFSGEDLAFFVRANIRSGARYAMDRRVYVPHYKRRAIEPVPTAEQIQEAMKRTAEHMAMK